MYMTKSLMHAFHSHWWREICTWQCVLVYVLEVMLDRHMYLTSICSSLLVVGSTCHLRLIHLKLTCTLDNLYFCHCCIFYTQKVLPFCTKFDIKNFGGSTDKDIIQNLQILCDNTVLQKLILQTVFHNRFICAKCLVLCILVT